MGFIFTKDDVVDDFEVSADQISLGLNDVRDGGYKNEGKI